MKGEVKPGYKQTDVGVIPEDWEVKTLDSVAHVTSGKRLPLGSSLTAHETPHPYIRVTDMRPGTVSLADIMFVPVDVFPTISRFRIYKDDIFISVAGTLGIVGRVPQELDGANLTENADRITNITCSQDFLLHVLMSPLIQTTIDSLQTVGAQPKLALTRIRKFLIPVPPTLAEQQAIAEALSDVDALISALDRLIAKKRAIKQGAMQELLTGRRRLPGFDGEWDTKKLGEYGQFRGGSGFPTRYQGDVEGDYPFFKVSDMNNQGNSTFMVNSNNWISEDTRKQIGANIFPTNTIVFAKIGAAVFLERKKILSQESCIDNNMMGLILDPVTADHRFFHYLLLSVQLGKLVAATALPSLNGRDIADLEFGIPPLAEQTAIAAVLSDMDAEIAALERRRDKTKLLKQGMMQELLTGRIRLVDSKGMIQ